MTNEIRTHYLYKITNLMNDKIYIGQTVAPSARWRDHRTAAIKRPVQVISKAIQKYGEENFVFEIIAECKGQVNADELEILLIQQYDSHFSTGKGYNVNLGGETAPKSEGTKEKIRQSLLGKKHTEKRKYNISQAHLGQIAWNAGTKGIMKPNQTSFAKGKPSPNKGRKRIFNPDGTWSMR